MIGDAGDILVTVAGVIVRALAVALPLGLLALVGWLAERGWRVTEVASILWNTARELATSSSGLTGESG